MPPLREDGVEEGVGNVSGAMAATAAAGELDAEDDALAALADRTPILNFGDSLELKSKSI